MTKNAKVPALVGAGVGLALFLAVALLPALLYGGYAGVMLAGGIFGTPVTASFARPRAHRLRDGPRRHGGRLALRGRRRGGRRGASAPSSASPRRLPRRRPPRRRNGRTTSPSDTRGPGSADPGLSRTWPAGSARGSRRALGLLPPHHRAATRASGVRSQGRRPAVKGHRSAARSSAEVRAASARCAAPARTRRRRDLHHVAAGEPDLPPEARRMSADHEVRARGRPARAFRSRPRTPRRSRRCRSRSRRAETPDARTCATMASSAAAGSAPDLVGPELPDAERRLPVRAVVAGGARADLDEPAAAAEELVRVERPGREAVPDPESLLEQVGVRVDLHDPEPGARRGERLHDRPRGGVVAAERDGPSRAGSRRGRGRGRARRWRAGETGSRRALAGARVRVERAARRVAAAPSESMSSCEELRDDEDVARGRRGPASRARAGQRRIVLEEPWRGAPAGRGSRRAGSPPPTSEGMPERAPRARLRCAARSSRQRVRTARVGRGAVQPALQRELLGAPGRDEVHAAAGGAEQERELVVASRGSVSAARVSGAAAPSTRPGSRVRARTNSTSVRTPNPVPPFAT